MREPSRRFLETAKEFLLRFVSEAPHGRVRYGFLCNGTAESRQLLRDELGVPRWSGDPEPVIGFVARELAAERVLALTPIDIDEYVMELRPSPKHIAAWPTPGLPSLN